jgi:hypothetical protein
MSARVFARLNALGGLLGAVMLGISFAINPGPPQDHATRNQLIAFGNAYHTQILTGAWLQAAGTVLLIIFALALVHIAGAKDRFTGWLTLFGGGILTATGLVEVTFYLSAITGTPATTGLISLDLIHAVQHIYFMVAAPMVFFPLGMLIIGSRVLPRALGCIALLLGAVFAVLGIASLYAPLQTLDNLIGIFQGFWWLVAAATLLVRPDRNPAQMAPLKSPELATSR